MKIMAAIPTRKVVGPGWTSFETDVLEVEVIKVIREPCDCTRRRYHYTAIVCAPASMHPDHPKLAYSVEGTIRVNISRRLNPKWKPPCFQHGGNVWLVPEAG